MANRVRTYGRGILRFASLEPCRLPGQKVANGTQKRERAMDNSRVQNGGGTHVLKSPGTTDYTSSLKRLKYFFSSLISLHFFYGCFENLAVNQERILSSFFIFSFFYSPNLSA